MGRNTVRAAGLGKAVAKRQVSDEPRNGTGNPLLASSTRRAAVQSTRSDNARSGHRSAAGLARRALRPARAHAAGGSASVASTSNSGSGADCPGSRSGSRSRSGTAALTPLAAPFISTRRAKKSSAGPNYPPTFVVRRAAAPNGCGPAASQAFAKARVVAVRRQLDRRSVVLWRTFLGNRRRNRRSLGEVQNSEIFFALIGVLCRRILAGGNS